MEGRSSIPYSETYLERNVKGSRMVRGFAAKGVRQLEGSWRREVDMALKSTGVVLAERNGGGVLYFDGSKGCWSNGIARRSEFQNR